jgi:ADP-heptose:LPS heptosyltransferase/glycosyltransferase involved in cell wall biosynthesis
MNIKKMLKRETESLLKDINVGNRNDITDICMSMKFKDGHIHHVLPNEKKVAKELTEDLMSHVKIDVSPKPTSKQPPKEVVFHNRQAIGDILTFTAGVRDFKNTYPNTRVGVISTATHIWDNNPYIDHQFRDNDKIVKVGPGYLTNKSNTWNYHMCNAFRLSMEQSLGVPITQGDTRPDIWLTEEEYHRKPLINGPYWVIIIGGEPGWTAKMYPEDRWQEVINSLPNIKFVQLGMKRHPYAHLDNVIDYIGKTEDPQTGIRDLFNIFLHAQGSVGLVSMHMHLSAAFNNPCVVIAGAREPAWFTQYMGHQYIQTNGTIPECASYKACWKTSLKGCINHKDNIPKCVEIIRPDEIVNGIKKYYDGGRLEYGKKIKNTFFKNIVKEKKIFVVPTTTPVDNDLLKKYGFQWGGGSITDKDWIFIKDIFKKEKVQTVLEFGAGLSTLLFSSVVKSVETYETQPGWIKKIGDMASKNSIIKHWNGRVVPEPLKEKYDFAFVDGPAGGQNREWSTKYASEHADLVIVHDAGRPSERKWQAKYLEPNFYLAAKGGHRCHYWKKKKLREVIEIDTSKPLARMVTTTRGWGGSERSTCHIMKMLVDKGYRVELVPTGNVSGEYMKNIPKGAITVKWEELAMPSDLTILYCSDTIWNFNKRQWDIMEELRTDRKVMVLNYQLGGAGQVPWSFGWDKYIFLNSTKEQELIDRIPDAYTKVLPPPTDLTEFLKVEINYDYPLKLIRHNSQGDSKHPDYTNDMIRDVLRIDSSIEFHYMPARSDCMNHPQVYKYPKNNPPIPQFLAKGNCFWYHLPPGYQDQGPRVIIEAMACGLPVIADNRYGAKDRVKPEIGWLCDEYKDYLKVIEEIIKNPKILKEKGLAAKEYAKKEYVAEKWIEEILGENII